jgi:Fic family protein
MVAVSYHKGNFPPTGLDLMPLLPLIGRAERALGKYDGTLGGVLNPNVLISPMMNREAEKSSRIEGTQATLREVLEFEAGEDREEPERTADIQEIINYRFALSEAIKALNTLPLSQRLIKEIHQQLMQGVRGRNSNPGNYRKTQNWIGPEGCTEAQARYIPSVAQDLPDNMYAWEKYMNTSQPNALVQLALVHAEFEAIHPFLDGNGRIGRLIVPLFLYEKKLTSSPSFYISEQLEKDREEYYARLQAISESEDWIGWCKFFLTTIADQAEHNIKKAEAILLLHEQKRDSIVDVVRSQYAVRALDYFFIRPIFNSVQFRKDVEIPPPTANRIIKELRDAKILTPIREGRGRRSGIYAFSELLEIIQ